MAPEGTVATHTPGHRDEVPVLGYREYWYPAEFSRKVKRRPVHIRLLGDDLVAFRDSATGKLSVLDGWCPHRGAALWCGKSHFPGTISCPYHGWTFDGEGTLRAVLSEGPDSPMASKVRNRSYPARELHGVIWVWMGDGEPVPIEDELPKEFFDPTISSRQADQTWACNWRVTLDNPGDSHPVYLHRSSLLTLFTPVPSYMRLRSEATDDAVKFWPQKAEMQAEYPGLGKFPSAYWWRRSKSRSARFDPQRPTMELKLPCSTTIDMSKLLLSRFAVPVDAGHTRNFIFHLYRSATFAERLRFHWYYWSWYTWVLHLNFIRQDKWVLESLNYTRPERLSAGDAGMIKWRLLSRKVRQSKDGPAER